MARIKTNAKIEFADFQTPLGLARQVSSFPAACRTKNPEC
jgi:hypothetical protein